MDVPNVPTKEDGVKKGDGHKTVEVHMVYADWCGHSQSALPEFDKLIDESNSNKVTTQSGSPVTFHKTEEQSPGFKLFKGSVKGFPTYMVVTKVNGEVTSKKELPLSSRKKEGILDAASKLA